MRRSQVAGQKDDGEGNNTSGNYIAGKYFNNSSIMCLCVTTIDAMKIAIIKATQFIEVVIDTELIKGKYLVVDNVWLVLTESKI